MKYRSVNQLDNFEFHDADFTLIKFDNDELTVSVKNLNIHKNTVQNPSEYDMEIEYAKIVFKGFRVHSFELGRTWKRDANGNTYSDDPVIIYEGKKAEDKIMQELQNQVWVYYLGKENNFLYCIEGSGIEPLFTVQFSFESVIIEWDNYLKKAWYELHKFYIFDITLDTPDGENNVSIYCLCHYEDVSLYEKLEEVSNINISIKYDGKEFYGYGKDYYWIDAFADLQKQLPDGVTIKCCLTCRYGNMCPVGNKRGELFCTKDVTINQKSDLFFYTEDETERTKRSKHYTNICKDYQPQSDDYYTYNDFPYYFK